MPANGMHALSSSCGGHVHLSLVLAESHEQCASTFKPCSHRQFKTTSASMDYKHLATLVNIWSDSAKIDIFQDCKETDGYNEHGDVGLGLDVELPLMKGRAFEVTRRHIRKQRISEDCLKQSVPMELLASRHKFRKKPKTCSDYKPGKFTLSGLCEDFQEHYANELQFAFGPDAKISPAPVSVKMQAQFFRFMRHNHRDAVRLGYHGTHKMNFKSIFQNGLRIPGNGGVKIVNGCAHGVGIYTAKLGSATLSQSFTRGTGSMLVCGILDEIDELSMNHRNMPERDGTHEPRQLKCGRLPKAPDLPVDKPVYVAPASQFRMGSFQVHKQTKGVIHVGDAQVVFNEKRVIPLLQVDNLPNVFYRPEWQPSTVKHAESIERQASNSANQHEDRLPAHELTIRRHNARRVRQLVRKKERNMKTAFRA